MNEDFIVIPGLIIIWFVVGFICGRIKTTPNHGSGKE